MNKLYRWLVVMLTLKLAFAGVTMKPSESSKESYEEIEDLANNNNFEQQRPTEDVPFAHHDEDQLTSENIQNLKSDVEIVESSEILKETNEIEEQFRGSAALKINTNYLSDENIETNGEISSHPLVKNSHFYTSLLLGILAILSIAIYAGLVIWRSHLEQRYGMRELLITDDFDEYYRQQQQHQQHGNYLNNNNNNNNINNNDDANNNGTIENGMRQSSYLVQA